MAAVKKPTAKDLELEKRKAENYARLKEIRQSKTCTLKPTSYLKTQILMGSKEPVDFKLRYYQVQGALHLLLNPAMLLGDACGLGKTIQVLVALAHLYQTKPEGVRVLIIAPKSAVGQWASEIEKFMVGVKALPIHEGEGKDAVARLQWRKNQYKAWVEATEPTVLIMSYTTLVRDWTAEMYQPLRDDGQPDPNRPIVPGVLDQITSDAQPNLMVITDEATAYKSTRTKTWEIVQRLFMKSFRRYALTATMLKNRLDEAYAIYAALLPGLFKSRNAFFEAYCQIELKSVKGSRVKIPIIKGYKNLDKFREHIDPYFLGRAKHEVSSELPSLTTREIVCGLSAGEDAKYEEALRGLLELGDGTQVDYTETKALTALIYCQLIVNSLALLKFSDGQTTTRKLTQDDAVAKAVGSKERALLDLLGGELADEKVIVYTRFASHIPRLRELVKKELKVATVAIDGSVSGKDRTEAQKAFQDLSSDTNIIFISDAGSEAVNLQAAGAMIFYDAPWSWGTYVQLLGRMIRIGSIHQAVVAYHLVAARSNGDDTIDHHVLIKLRGKKSFIDQVLGEAELKALEFENANDSLAELLQAVRGEKRKK